jgi:hypothetical protein
MPRVAAPAASISWRTSNTNEPPCSERFSIRSFAGYVATTLIAFVARSILRSCPAAPCSGQRSTAA